MNKPCNALAVTRKKSPEPFILDNMRRGLINGEVVFLCRRKNMYLFEVHTQPKKVFRTCVFFASVPFSVPVGEPVYIYIHHLINAQDVALKQIEKMADEIFKHKVRARVDELPRVGRRRLYFKAR